MNWRTYDQNSNLTSSKYESGYDTLSGDYRQISLKTFMYNDGGLQTYIYRFYADTQTESISEYETTTTYDCDGRILKSVTTDNVRGRVNTYTVDYFDLPECALERKITDPFTVFPNPAHDYVHISFRNIHTSPTFKIYDMSGKLQQGTFIENNNIFSLNTSSLYPGMYIIHVEAGEKVYWHKIVKI